MPFLNASTTNNQADISLYYEDHGEGRPVVLIHGWPLSSRAWEKQVPALIAAGYRVISYDRRGFGQSSQPWQGYDYDNFAADLNALLTHLDVQDATLVGFSMGGGEVARYIATYGEQRVASIVLACAVTPFMHIVEGNPEGGIDDPNIEGLKDGVKTDRLAFLENFTQMFFGVDGNVLISEEARQYFKRIASMASPKGTLDCIDAFCKTDFRADLEKITVPALILHGDADAIVPYEVSGKRAHAMIAHSSVALIAGAPHGFNATHAEEFNEALLTFLS